MAQTNILLEAGTNELEVVEFYLDELAPPNGDPAEGQTTTENPDGTCTYRGYYGVNVAKVLEIIRMPKVTELPEVQHPSVLGAFNLRSRIIPLVDLAMWLEKQHAQTTEEPKTIVTEFNNVTTAFMVSGVNRIHRGVELGATYRLDDHWSFDLAGTVSQYYYSNNPIGVSNSENGDIVDEIERVYMKGVYVGGVPQVAGTLGINYFIDYWFLGLNINGFGRNFVEAAPSRRVASLYDEVTPDDPALMDAYRTLTHQEEFDAGYTIDVSVGKIFYLGRKNSINVNLAVNNILNKKDIKTGGYEQGRARVDNPSLFKSKYFYMQGINCYLNVSYRF